MCGIAGFIDKELPEPLARERLARMLGRIHHRGPDGSGFHFHEGTGLAAGMRRLSIIDLEGGSQPIWNEDRSVGVVFNGEIYNYRELQGHLRAAGHRLKTESDTEVLVHLYEEYGDAMLSRLRGMFAFAIFDHRAQRLLIARDHFGQKPLYYSCDGKRFAFASELKSLWELPWISHERDPAALLDYCAWLSLPSPRTHFRHIAKLPAGALLSFPLSDVGRARPCHYWRYELKQLPDLTDSSQAVEALDRALEESMRLHMRADVPLGILLSSGLDSRTVAAYAQEMMSGTMQTFTVGFGGEDSEAADAAKTAREIGSRHHTLEVTAADLGSSIEKIAYHLDEPVGDPAAFAVLKVCELARQHVKVLLSGEGADELFAGYDTRYAGMLQTISRSEWLRPTRFFLPPAPAGPLDSRWLRLRARAHRTRGAEALTLRMEGLPGDIRTPRGLSTAQLASLRDRAEELGRALHPQRDLLSSLLVLDLEWQLAESLLQKADKMSMAASIELRTPLLDTGIAEIAARIPSNLKLTGDGIGKLILRRCLARKLHEPLTRPKRGFPIPLGTWLRGELREQVEAALFAGDAPCLEVLERPLLRQAWEDFLANRWDGGRLFYSLWLYNTWARSLQRTPESLAP